jgi:SM-20-related protein
VKALSEAAIESLGTSGFTWGTGLLGEGLARRAHVEAVSLRSTGALRRAGVRRGTDHAVDEVVRGDSITWIDREASGALGEVFERFEALRQELNEGAYLGLRRIELQLAHYPGTGAGYQRHRDAFPGDDNRRLTAIVYLNPEWRPAHGGTLSVFTEPPQTIEPRLDTYALFRSALVEHEVNPSFSDRFAITAWFSAR